VIEVDIYEATDMPCMPIGGLTQGKVNFIGFFVRIFEGD